MGRKMNVRTIAAAKRDGRRMTWLTCYDYSMARCLNQTDLDMILVGDSGGMVVLGYPDTTPVTMAEMLMLSSAVRRGAPGKFLVGDMPKGSYEIDARDAAENAMLFAKVAGCDAIKLEGGSQVCEAVRAITRAGIPVFGHIGLTPQTSGSQGGYRVMGRGADEVERLTLDAQSLEAAGVAAILIEATPPSVSALIRDSVSVPVLGIGAGPQVDGQLMILHDLLGIYPEFRPKFAKCYVPEALPEFEIQLQAHGAPTSTVEPLVDGIYGLAQICVNRFIDEVRSGRFPDSHHCYEE